MSRARQNLDLRDQEIACLLSKTSHRANEDLSPDEKGERDGTVAAKFLRDQLRKQLEQKTNKTD